MFEHTNTNDAHFGSSIDGNKEKKSSNDVNSHFNQYSNTKIYNGIFDALLDAVSMISLQRFQSLNK